MSCCKNYSPVNGEKEGSSILGKIVFFIVGLIVITLLIPVMWGIIVYFLFNTSIMNKENNILPAITFIWNTMLKQGKYKDEEEEEDDELYDEEYELLDYEKIE